MQLEVERQVLEGGLQPVTPSKKNTSPAHRGEGAGAASAQPDLWAPAGWKKSSEHFSKSSLRQKLQSDRCKPPPDLQLLPLLSQPQAAVEVTLAPRAVDMAAGAGNGGCTMGTALAGFLQEDKHGQHLGVCKVPPATEGALGAGITTEWVGQFSGMCDLSHEKHEAHLPKKVEIGLG